jgi:hypothetical protein
MKVLLTLLLLICAPAWAAQYKCVIDNKTEYRDSPCPPGTEKPMQDKPQMDSNPAKRDEALKRLEAEKQRAQTLERARLEKRQQNRKKPVTPWLAKKSRKQLRKKVLKSPRKKALNKAQLVVLINRKDQKLNRCRRRKNESFQSFSSGYALHDKRFGSIAWL